MAVETSGNNNPAGRNQFDRFTPELPYGDLKRSTELMREAPISGAPVAGRALNLPERAHDAAARPQAPRASTSAAPAGLSPYAPAGAPTPAQVWAMIASVPGASPLVQQLAAQAQGAV
jgi:hypothetical protein